MDIGRPRKGGRGKGEEKVESPASENDPGRPTGQSEQNTFREQLPNESKSARAESGANGNFAVTRGRAREKKIRDIGAGDEEDASDRA